MLDLKLQIQRLTLESKNAAKFIATLNSNEKNKILKSMADILLENLDALLAANAKDIDAAKKQNLSAAMLDRLRLSNERIVQMVDSLHQVIQLNDPIGETSGSTLRPNGIRVEKMRIPLGVILMIYESRPNVAVEAAALALKAGNGIILRGGKESFHSNKAIVDCWHQALAVNGISKTAVSMVPTQEHEAINLLLQASEHIDLVIPRGGERLIKAVTENSKIPVIQHYKGICHLYVDKDADLKIAQEILINGKISRPGVCNALECLVVHEDIAEKFLTQVSMIAEKYQLNIKADPASCQYIKQAQEAIADDYNAEYLDLTLNVKQVKNFESAIAHIQEYSSNHTEVIITENINTANKFIRQINSSVVMVNASSRFSDGGELGLGAEIGISTSKLHAYGPMGHYQLTTEKYVVIGDGQVRT